MSDLVHADHGLVAVEVASRRAGGGFGRREETADGRRQLGRRQKPLEPRRRRRPGTDNIQTARGTHRPTPVVQSVGIALGAAERVVAGRRRFEGQLLPVPEELRLQSVLPSVRADAVEQRCPDVRQLRLDGHRAAAGVRRRPEEQGRAGPGRRRRRSRGGGRTAAAVRRRHRGHVTELVDDALLGRRQTAVVHGTRQLVGTCQTSISRLLRRIAALATDYGMRPAGKESVPIQLAQCWFPAGAGRFRR